MDLLTTWTTETSPSRTASAFAAPQAGEDAIQHPAWCEAYDGLMAQLAAGPGVLALLGPAGTGKTWLLQAVLAALGEQGRPVVLVQQGELPIEAAAGTVVLVDEAARMDDGRLAQLAGARDTSIVLVGLPALASRLGQLAHPAAIIPLASLRSQDMPGFAASWLAARDLPAEMLDERAVRRLFDHSGGVPRLVVQFLRAALALNRQMGAAVIGAGQMDEVASLRLGETAPETAVGAESTPGDVGKSLAVAGPAAPGPIPAEAPVLPEAAIAPDALARPWARPGRARLAAVLAPWSGQEHTRHQSGGLSLSWSSLEPFTNEDEADDGR